jgi:hypothetical protein
MCAHSLHFSITAITEMCGVLFDVISLDLNTKSTSQFFSVTGAQERGGPALCLLKPPCTHPTMLS